LRFFAYAFGGLILMGVVVWAGLPMALTAVGFHPHYEVPEMDMDGRRALIVTTSTGVMAENGRATGVFPSEMTAPYYVFLDAGMEVDVASIEGGEIPIEPFSLGWPIASEWDRRYVADPEFREKVANSLRIGNIDTESYDIVFLAGGWGAAYDLAQSDALGAQVSAAYANGAVVGGVCHGPLGLLRAVDPSGDLLVAGRRVTAVTDKQVAELGITHTPMHPQRDLRAAGAVFESETAFRDFFATHVVIDGRLVTGQNQNSGAETAHRMMEAVLAN